jgi:hypothetical protein
MPTRTAKFELDEEIWFEGKPMRIAGWVRYEGANAELSTRYLLAEPGGAPFVVEESGGNFSLLRPFAPGAQPQATGSVIRVMREKYTLSRVRKLKIVGYAGQPPGGTPKAELLVSGLFAGRMGSLLRELPAGASTQIFFSSKPLGPGDVLAADQYALRREAGRLAAEAAALASVTGKGAGWGRRAQIAALCVVVLLVLLGLAYAFWARPG